MEDDAIRWFMKDFKKSGILQELRRREYFLTRTEMRKLKDRRAEKRRKRAEGKKRARYKQTYNEKGKLW